jgi:DNA topoisomerase-3
MHPSKQKHYYQTRKILCHPTKVFSTNSEIMIAWNNLINLDYNSAEAVDARTELDLRIGAVFTRFQTLTLKPKFYDLKDQSVLSYGIYF